MKLITLYLGLDVHRDSITIAIAEPGSKGEIRLFGTRKVSDCRFTPGLVARRHLQRAPLSDFFSPKLWGTTTHVWATEVCPAASSHCTTIV